MTKLLVDGFSTKITHARQELRVPVHPSSADLANRTLRSLSGRLKAKRRQTGTRWRRFPASRQALLAPAHLRCGDTYARLAAGLGIGITTAYRSIRETVDVLATFAPTLAEGKHKHHGMNIQVLTDPLGHLPWDSPALPGSTHDPTVDRARGIAEVLAATGLSGCGRFLPVSNGRCGR